MTSGRAARDVERVDAHVGADIEEDAARRQPSGDELALATVEGRLGEQGGAVARVEMRAETER